MNTDERRALKKLREMYPKALHGTLESEFRAFIKEIGDKYKTPMDFVNAYIKWLKEEKKDVKLV